MGITLRSQEKHRQLQEKKKKKNRRKEGMPPHPPHAEGKGQKNFLPKKRKMLKGKLKSKTQKYKVHTSGYR